MSFGVTSGFQARPCHLLASDFIWLSHTSNMGVIIPTSQGCLRGCYKNMYVIVREKDLPELKSIATKNYDGFRYSAALDSIRPTILIEMAWLYENTHFAFGYVSSKLRT